MVTFFVQIFIVVIDIFVDFLAGRGVFFTRRVIFFAVLSGCFRRRGVGDVTLLSIFFAVCRGLVEARMVVADIFYIIIFLFFLLLRLFLLFHFYLAFPPPPPLFVALVVVAPTPRYLV